MRIRPTDLPELRSEVVHFHASHGPAFFDACIRAGKMPVRPAGSMHEAAQLLAKAEAQRVLKGELFWVDSDMTQLAKTAAQSLPEFTLMPEDLPSPWGFMAFAEPIYVYCDPEEGRQVHLTAVSWGPWQPGPAWPSGGLWVSWYSDRELNLGPANAGLVSDAESHIIRSVYPPLSYDLEDQYPFSSVPLPSINPHTGEVSQAFNLGEGYEKGDLLRVTWLLMQQPLAQITEVEPDRPARKRLQRAGQAPRPVRVIALRRPKRTTNEASDSGREYHHQWIVRGHWRNQWHPARQLHRPVWIAPHIKGPDDAPLIGGEKVHALRH